MEGEISSNSRTSRRHIPQTLPTNQILCPRMNSRHGPQLSSLPPPSHSHFCILLEPQPRHCAEQTLAPNEVDEGSGTTSQSDMIMHMDIDRELSRGSGGRRVHGSQAESSQFSPLLSLPNETLHTVFNYLPPPALVSLLQVCRRLHGVVERILYATISINESVDTNTARPSPNVIITPHTTLSFCTTVRARSYLLPCIRRLAIRWTRDRARKNEVMNLSSTVIPSLQSVLLSAPNVDSLELHLAGWRGGYEELLRGCSFRLKSLALSGPLNAPVEWFLSSQPGIVYLHLGDHHAPLRDLSPSDLPRLETFRGDALAAASILPGRPVLGLALSGYEPSERSLISFAYTKYPIRCLDLSGLSVTPTQLLTISKHLTALETLRMRLALRHTLHFTFSGMVSFIPLFLPHNVSFPPPTPFHSLLIHPTRSPFDSPLSPRH